LKSSTNDQYTDKELERIEWFRDAEDEGIKESCLRMLSGMRRETDE
jgi:hypothetical protein